MYQVYNNLMDNKNQEVFLQLLRIGPWGKGTLLIRQPISNKDWSQIYSCATTQTVRRVIFDRFVHLEESQLPPQSLRLQWTIRIVQIERCNYKMNTVLASQFKNFTELGLDPILQKGEGVANWYLKPEHRVCGDILVF
ncbi:nucleotidyltransferase family protein [Sphingobacterium sp. ML3W]|uniref:nucleotidyltransferase family protein n=1 Tax=Sphingobacterium sp. ML3W TaxID=1538644 RepID=UPI0009E047EC|nr:nucleotidyltransferase family protein [Sphingobacterium sp. ML3W]